MAKLRDRVQCATATTGTGTVTLGAAMPGFRTFSTAYGADAIGVSYVIVDGTAWETGVGNYSLSTNTLTRSPDVSSTGAVLNLSGAATVGVAFLSRDHPGDWPVLIVNRDGGASGFQFLGSYNGFTTLMVDNVAVDTHGGWDSALYQWVVPQTGLYDVQGKLRLSDNSGAVSFGVGMDVSNMDSADFAWTTFPVGAVGTENRSSWYNSRLMSLAAGQRLRLFAYVDANYIGINKASLVATRVR